MPILYPSVIRTLFLFLSLLTCNAAWAADARSPDTDRSAPPSVMEDLAEAGIEQAVKAISKAGVFYPFALMRTEDGKVQAMGYEGPPDKAPPSDQFARNLYRQVRVLIGDNPQLEAAAVYRLHTADNNDGEKVPGVWCLVDHRDAPALIVFQPLVLKGDGSEERVLGEIVYQKSEDSLFPEKDRKASPSAD